MKKTYLLLLFALSILWQQSHAQTFSSVDIQAGPPSSNPQNLTAFNGKVYFNATGDTLAGTELWMSDGTPAGTSLVKDIYAGPNASFASNLTIVGTQLFFSAYDSAHGSELWVTDGTSGGTHIVSDIQPGTSSSGPAFLTSYNGKLYFTADDGIHGAELWVSDGTPGGTALIKDINPGTSGSYPAGYSGRPGSLVYGFNEFNNKLYFRANDGVHGTELWATDGTTSGTTMVADVWAGPGDGIAFFMTRLGTNMIFTGEDSLHGLELWISDGTAGGTSLLKDIQPGTGGSYAGDYSAYTLFNGKLYFSADDGTSGYELWSTDGTSGGTTMVKDIWPGPSASDPASGYAFQVFQNKLYFNAYDSLNGSQLWSTDGTSSGTTLVKVLSTTPGYSSSPGSFLVYNSQLLFTADIDAVNGTQLWTSDGTAPGTHVISPPIAPNTYPLNSGGAPILANGSVFFDASFNAIGYELWIYHTAGTAITETSGDKGISAYPNPFSSALTLSGLQSGERYTIQILDMTGRENYASEIDHPSQNETLSMPDLATGVYLMRVQGQSSSQTFRMVKN